MTLQFFGNNGFFVIITFWVFGDSFCGHIYGNVRLTSDSDLNTYVYLSCCTSLLGLRLQFTQPLLNIATPICSSKVVLTLIKRDRCSTFRSQLHSQLPSRMYIIPYLKRSRVVTWLARLARHATHVFSIRNLTIILQEELNCKKIVNSRIILLKLKHLRPNHNN